MSAENQSEKGKNIISALLPKITDYFTKNKLFHKNEKI